MNNNAGNGDTGLAALLAAGRVRKMICSFPRQSDSWVFDGLYRAGGSSSRWCRRATSPSGCGRPEPGIGAFFCPTGVGTPLAEGKEAREIDGRDYVLEYPLKRRRRADRRATAPTGWATSSTARPPATSVR